jgi:hypothetical protein
MSKDAAGIGLGRWWSGGFLLPSEYHPREPAQVSKYPAAGMIFFECGVETFGSLRGGSIISKPAQYGG